MPEPEWFDRAFDADWLQIVRPFITPERTAAEVEGVVELLRPLGAGARLADIPCGFGRHSRALAARGFRVAGIDLAPAQLAYARSTPGAGPPPPGLGLVRADMRRLPLRPGSLDAAITLNESIGYGETDEDDRTILREIRAALRPGGLHVLEAYHKDGTLWGFQPRQYNVSAGVIVHVTRRIEEQPLARLHERISWGEERGSRGGTTETRIRLYTEGELRAHLAGAGLEVLDVRGSLRGLPPFSSESSRFVALSRAPGREPPTR